MTRYNWDPDKGQYQSGTAQTVTAHAGGTQVAGLPVSASNINIAVCASGNDSIVLPFAVAGTVMHIANNGVAAAKAYGPVAVNPATGVIDTIDGVAGSTGITITNAHRTILFCTKNGAWQSMGGTVSA